METAEAQRYAGQFRRALQDGDAMQLWKLWAHVFPQMPGPTSIEQATAVMHRARTEAQCVEIKGRCYSHAWLVERGLPSALPDHLKKSADRLYPRVVVGVGISVKMPAFLKPVRDEVHGAMIDAVEILSADGVDLNDRSIVHPYMFSAREQALKRTLGTSVAARGLLSR